jgi:hypothetical protein
MTGAMGVGLIGKAATADALLNCCLAGAMFTLYLYFTRNKLRYLLATAFFTGIGFITKGPISALIPAAVSLIFALWDRRIEQWLRMVTNPSAWLIFILIATPWYIVHYLREGSAFLENFIGTHNIGRFSSAMEGHDGAWWYYLPAIILIAFPFGLLVLQPLIRIRTIIDSHIGRYLLSWFIFVFIFFSFSATKLPHYMIYGLTPLIILTALQMPDKPNLKIVFYPLFLLIILLILLPLLIEFILPGIDETQLSSALRDTINGVNASYLLLLGIILGLSIWLFSNNYWPHQGRLLSAGLVSTFIVSEFLLPLVAQIQQEPIKEAGIIAAEYDKPVVIWRLNTPSFSVYSEKVAPRRKPVTGELVLTKSHHLEELTDHEVLFEKNGIALALITLKELSDVSSITTHVEPPLHMVSSNTVSDTGNSNPSVSAESITIPNDQLTGDIDPRSVTMGDDNHSRGWIGRSHSATASTQALPQIDHNSPDFGPIGSAMGTSAEDGIRGTKTTRSHRYPNDHRHWPGIQKRQFSFWPHLDPIRASRLLVSMDERGPTALPLPLPSTIGYSRRAFPKCCWHPLAYRHYDRYGNRLAIGYFRQSAGSNLIGKRDNENMARSIPAAVRALPASRIRYRVHQCQGIPARYSAYCARRGLHGLFENRQNRHHHLTGAYLVNRGR